MPMYGSCQGLARLLREERLAALKLWRGRVEIDNPQINTYKRLDGGSGAVGGVGRAIATFLQHDQSPIADLLRQRHQQRGHLTIAVHREHHPGQWVQPASILPS